MYLTPNLANPPLPLFLSIEDLLKSPSAKRSKKHKPLNRFLIYRRNYAASFPLDKRPKMLRQNGCLKGRHSIFGQWIITGPGTVYLWHHPIIYLCTLFLIIKPKFSFTNTQSNTTA